MSSDELLDKILARRNADTSRAINPSTGVYYGTEFDIIELSEFSQTPGIRIVLEPWLVKPYVDKVFK